MTLENKRETGRDDVSSDRFVFLKVFEKERRSRKRTQKGNRTVKCICPRCEKLHYQQMRWIGRGSPRKYCQRCKTHLFSRGSIDFRK